MATVLINPTEYRNLLEENKILREHKGIVDNARLILEDDSLNNKEVVDMLRDMICG